MEEGSAMVAAPEHTQLEGQRAQLEELAALTSELSQSQERRVAELERDIRKLASSAAGAAAASTAQQELLAEVITQIAALREQQKALGTRMGARACDDDAQPLEQVVKSAISEALGEALRSSASARAVVSEAGAAAVAAGKLASSTVHAAEASNRAGGASGPAKVEEDHDDDGLWAAVRADWTDENSCVQHPTDEYGPRAAEAAGTPAVDVPAANSQRASPSPAVERLDEVSLADGLTVRATPGGSPERMPRAPTSVTEDASSAPTPTSDGAQPSVPVSQAGAVVMQAERAPCEQGALAVEPQTGSVSSVTNDSASCVAGAACSSAAADVPFGRASACAVDAQARPQARSEASDVAFSSSALLGSTVDANAPPSPKGTLGTRDTPEPAAATDFEAVMKAVQQGKEACLPHTGAIDDSPVGFGVWSSTGSVSSPASPAAGTSASTTCCAGPSGVADAGAVHLGSQSALLPPPPPRATSTPKPWERQYIQKEQACSVGK